MVVSDYDDQDSTGYDFFNRTVDKVYYIKAHAHADIGQLIAIKKTMKPIWLNERKDKQRNFKSIKR